MEKKQVIAKTLTGKVVSNKMDKTIVVEVVRRFAHPKYGKIIYKTKKFHVHSETKPEIGTEVKIVQTNKISKTKAFKMV